MRGRRRRGAWFERERWVRWEIRLGNERVRGRCKSMIENDVTYMDGRGIIQLVCLEKKKTKTSRNIRGLRRISKTPY